MWFSSYSVGEEGLPPLPGLYQPSNLSIAAVVRPEITPERMSTAKSFILSLNAVGLCLRRLVRFRTLTFNLSPPCLGFCLYYISRGIYFQDGIFNKYPVCKLCNIYKRHKNARRVITVRFLVFMQKHPFSCR